MKRGVLLYPASAALPLVPAAASVAAALGPEGWGAVGAPLVRATTPDALLYTAACLVVAAPLVGVAVRAVRPLTFAALIFCTTSALLTLARLGGSPETLGLVVTSHAVLASVTLALVALGACAGSLLRDPLDAAAVSLAVAVTAAFGLLVAGAPVGEMPAPALKMALLASPLMSVASAAHVDVVRSDIWYQISPLAHVRLEYPALGTVCGSYLLTGGLGFAATWALTGKGWR